MTRFLRRLLSIGTWDCGTIRRRWLAALLLLVSAAHLALWGLLRQTHQAPDLGGKLASVSYAPLLEMAPTDAEHIRADLKRSATMTSAIRLYTSTGGSERVPPIAAEFGLKVTLGAWISGDEARNQREIEAAISLARHNRNVTAIVVGNETLYRGEQTIDRLIELIKQVKKSVNVPVTTGEIWFTWRDDPKLVANVDFIAAHILPYWENYSDKQAVDQALSVHRLLREKYPGKRVVVAESGWPSAATFSFGASPNRLQQAAVLRDFVARAEAIGVEYNIVEAIDQPWKTNDGTGPYWGIRNAAGEPKFPWTGSIDDGDYWTLAATAVAIGVALSVSILWIREPPLLLSLGLLSAASATGAWLAWVVAYRKSHYLNTGTALVSALQLGLPVLVVWLGSHAYRRWPAAR